MYCKFNSWFYLPVLVSIDNVKATNVKDRLNETIVSILTSGQDTGLYSMQCVGQPGPGTADRQQQAQGHFLSSAVSLQLTGDCHSLT